MNTRQKGQRTFQKAMRYALSFPGTVAIPLYQVSRWATPQPFDLLLFRPGYLVRLVEVRTTAWGVAKTNTRQLAALPGTYYLKQVWRFRSLCTLPDIRQWMEPGWLWQVAPWSSEEATP